MWSGQVSGRNRDRTCDPPLVRRAPVSGVLTCGFTVKAASVAGEVMGSLRGLVAIGGRRLRWQRMPRASTGRSPAVEPSIPSQDDQAHYRGHFVIRPGLPNPQVNVTDPTGAVLTFADLPADVVGTAGWDYGLHKLGWSRTSDWRPDNLGSVCNVTRITRERSTTK